jgi:nucleoside-diphosphate-sugar epimerase
MRVFVAGASGAIGQPIVAELIRQGHVVTAMTHSDTGARVLAGLGATVARVSAMDAAALEKAVRDAKAEMVIDELTALPKHPSDLPAALPADRKLRLEGGGNLHRAAQACGVRRYLQQASGFFLKAGSGLADESESLAIDASAGVAASAKTYAELESRVLGSKMEGVALRYGFFYGPNTWYFPEAGAADQVQRQQFPIVGQGQAVWSFVHVEDAALATIAAMTAAPGVYNVVDDDPSPVSRWLPDFARWVGAPAPPHITEDQARSAAGEDAIYYGTKLRGASNKKAREVLGFKPRRLEWLRG